MGRVLAVVVLAKVTAIVVAVVVVGTATAACASTRIVGEAVFILSRYPELP